jgi:hypothetical protein
MPGVPITDIVLGTSTTVSALVAAWAIWMQQHKDKKQSADERIVGHLAPLSKEIEHLKRVQHDMPSVVMERVEGAISKAMAPVREDLSGINAKIEPLWAILLNIAKDQADILHHPDPDRAELDQLLEHFKADILTPDEDLLLRRYLHKIKDWSGEDIGFKVYPNEPTNAGILLRIMEYGKYLKAQGQIS